MVAATDRRPAQSQPFADMPVNFLARYERYIKTLDRKMWLVGDEKMDISTYVAPTVQMVSDSCIFVRGQHCQEPYPATGRIDHIPF